LSISINGCLGPILREMEEKGILRGGFALDLRGAGGGIFTETR
jgi:hypothetical protein